ncbi:hypothetical protein [Niabella drilacis]|uniref:DUF2975 domain-containing protein n=1 Tax=Niabella drilacis (strain DSM 25811 / CCM 8410 / CCUG 62505 / LMG 26954 / E90) TaxID=1285928 RepID=A0A1G6PFP3_NIADE|nr:hypothetical protein [Niabella drilacis]SDC78811.1 hypothetical protein SAMN04487894_10418 [Niabella drilacis]
MKYKTTLSIITSGLWCILLFSAQALIWHIRWFIPFIKTGFTNVVPPNQQPLVWFITQILTNIIFIYTGGMLLKLFGQYKKAGFFNSGGLRALHTVIYACIGLGVLGTVRVVAGNIQDLHLEEWHSLWAISNLAFRSFHNLLLFREPQSMYFLLAVLLWTLKQFLKTAATLKKENESFI